MTLISDVTKDILISVDLSELRVAVVEEGRTVEALIERRGQGSLVGNIYKAKVDNVLRGMEAAFVDLGMPRNGFLHVNDVVVPGQTPSRSRRRRKIDELLKPGQEILVQVVKDSMGTKGPRVTMELSIAGRFLVLSPNGEAGSGVSRRLPDGERERLRKLAKSIEVEQGGIIVRTAAAGATKDDLERDLRFVSRIWAQVSSSSEAKKAPSLVHAEADLSLKVIRDLLARNVQQVLVDSERQYRRILGWVRVTQPEFVDRIKLYSDAVPLFERHGVDQAILSTLNKRVDLPSGGYLIFDYGEAFTVIDVNTGRFVGSSSRLEDTITKNNIEAAREVMRQLRLRDIGGIIVIDFIDMAVAKNRAEVLKVLQEELEHDRTKTYLVEISPLGLVEMTRQNVTAGVRETLTRICPTCGGEGRVLSEQTMSVEAERRLRKVARSSGAEAFLVRMNARVATFLAGPGGTKLLELERETGKYFTVEPVERMPLTEIDVIREGMRVDVDGGALPVGDGDELRLKISEPHMYNTTDGVGRVNGGYGIVVGGAIGYVGQEHRIRIERATRTGAFASLLDAKATAIELEPEPEYAYELPELEREVGERLELEQRTKPRRTRQTAAKSRTAKAKDEPADEAESDAEAAAEEAPAKKPARRRTRKKAEPEAAAETAPEPVETADEELADGDAAATATRKRRRGKRGGRGRSKAPPAAADGVAAGPEPDVVAAETAPEPATDGEVKPKPRRRRTPAKARPAEPAAEEPAPAPAAPADDAAPSGDGRKPSGGILGRLLGS
ncbi:MAG TPA: Rne/Rng family ribonuclease [Gaiellales bacterium]